MAKIQDLPVELLSHIFEHLHILTLLKDMVWSNNNLRDSTLFPCAIARVSRRWKSIVSCRPKYWTRFAFDLALDDSPILDAPLWSKDQFFVVLVFDSSGSPNGPEISDPHIRQYNDRQREEIRVRSITEALLPHLNRCHSLKYDISYSTSLPPLPLILSHLSDRITSIQLNYRHGPHNVDFSAQGSHSVATPVAFTSLKRLSIDVATFISMTRLYPDWLDDLKLDTLELSQYEFEDDEDKGDKGLAYSSSEFFDYLHRLTIRGHIALRNLSIVDENQDESWSEDDATRILQCNFTFEGLSRKFLHKFSQMFGFFSEIGIFIACDMPDHIMDGNYCGELWLHHLPSNVNMEEVLAPWDGVILEVLSCPSFNDATLKHLSGSSVYDLCHLDIRNCDNFTLDALREFIRERRRKVDLPQFYNLLETITVSGKAPKMTAEQAAWFETQAGFRMC